MDKLWNDNPARPLWMDPKNTPCKEVKITGDISLFDVLPPFRVNKYRGGYFLKALVIQRNQKIGIKEIGR